MSRIIDISPTLNREIAVWPGDTAFRTFWTSRLEDGAAANVGSVTMSLHTGAHADAPLHVSRDGADIVSGVPLDVWVGPAEVIDLSGTPEITVEHVRRFVHSGIERALFRTVTVDPKRQSSDFCFLSAEAAHALVKLRVRLVGIDTPSVDSLRSHDLLSHHALVGGGVAILENLSLRDVSPGRYELIALPLKLTGMDASPVRAVLRTI